MSTPVARRVPALLIAIACGALLSGPVSAGAVPYRLALELNARETAQGDRETAASLTRRVKTHLVPMLERLGYEVELVKSARRAVREGGCHVAVRLDVDADRKVLMGHGVMYLGETSYDDRWLFGYTTVREKDPPRRSFRMQIRENSVAEPLTKATVPSGVVKFSSAEPRNTP